MSCPNAQLQIRQRPDAPRPIHSAAAQSNENPPGLVTRGGGGGRRKRLFNRAAQAHRAMAGLSIRSFFPKMLLEYELVGITSPLARFGICCRKPLTTDAGGTCPLWPAHSGPAGRERTVADSGSFIHIPMAAAGESQGHPHTPHTPARHPARVAVVLNGQHSRSLSHCEARF